MWLNFALTHMPCQAKNAYPLQRLHTSVGGLVRGANHEDRAPFFAEPSPIFVREQIAHAGRAKGVEVSHAERTSRTGLASRKEGLRSVGALMSSYQRSPCRKAAVARTPWASGPGRSGFMEGSSMAATQAIASATTASILRAAFSLAIR